MRCVDNPCRFSMSVNGSADQDLEHEAWATRGCRLRTRIPIIRSTRSCEPESAGPASISTPRPGRRHHGRSSTSSCKLLREGDTLKVTRLDRLSRSVLHLVTLGAELRTRKIGLHVIEQGIDTDTIEGRAMFGMLSVLAELQRELIVANTMDGLAPARARGRIGGRRPRLSEGQAALAQELYDARVKTVQQIADLFGVPRSTVYGHLNKATTVSRQPKKKSLQKA